MSTLGRVFGLAAALVFVSACGGGGGGDGESGGGTQPTFFTVSTSTTGTGSGTISPTSRSVSQGSTTSFTVSAASGSTIASVTGCGGTLSGSTYTTGAITAACTVSANFSNSGGTPPPTAYTVSTAVSGSGSGSISPSSVNVIPGGSATFNLFPNSDSELSGVSGCGGTIAGNSYTTDAIQSDCTVSVTFDLKQYGVSTTLSEGGSIEPTFRMVNHGSTTTFAVTSNEGFSIDQVTGCGGSLSNGTFTTGPITAACNIEATFLIKQYTVLASASENGTISPNTAIVDYGQAASFSVIPDVGYQVETIGGCGGALAGSIYTTAPIVADCQVGVSFVPLTTVGIWSVEILGDIEGFDEIYPTQLAHDGSAFIGQVQRNDPATGQYISRAFLWSRREGFLMFIMDGHAQSSPSQISSDGLTVSGASCPEEPYLCVGFVWKTSTEMIPLLLPGDVYSQLEGMSDNGGVAWGNSCDADRTCRAFIWTIEEGIREFQLEGTYAWARASTPDGSIVVGTIGGRDAMRWNRLTGIVDRFRVEGDDYLIPYDVSADGKVVVGDTTNNTSRVQRGFLWTEATGIQALLPSGSSEASAKEVSADGSAVVGEHSGSGYRRLYRWNATTGFEDLMIGDDPLSQYWYTYGVDISDDGARAIGRSCSTINQQGCTGFVWTDEQGVVPLVEPGREAEGSAVSGMSNDGRRVIGFDYFGAQPKAFAWTLENGLERLVLHQWTAVISGDGNTIAGQICNSVTCELAVLTATN